MEKEPKFVRKFDEEDIEIYYSNLINISTSPFDVTIAFGKAFINPAEAMSGNAEVIQKFEAMVQMSPEHARSLLKLLTEQMEKYNIRPDQDYTKEQKH